MVVSLKDSLPLSVQLRSLRMVLYSVCILALFLGSVLVPLCLAAGEFEIEREGYDPYTKRWDDTSVMQR